MDKKDAAYFRSRRQASAASLFLTVGEWHQIKRWRSGLTVRDTAKHLGMSVPTYRHLEQSDQALVPSLRNLSYGEMCRIRRNRAGMTQQEVADKIGVSRYWVILLEQGDDLGRDIGPLASFWGLQ